MEVPSMDERSDQWPMMDEDMVNVHTGDAGVHQGLLAGSPSVYPTQAPFNTSPNLDLMEFPNPANFNTHLWRASEDFGGLPLHSYSDESAFHFHSTAGAPDRPADYPCSDPPMPAYQAFDEEVFGMHSSGVPASSLVSVSQPEVTRSTEDHSLGPVQYYSPMPNRNQPFAFDPPLMLSPSNDQTDIYGDDLDLRATPYNSLGGYTFDGGADPGLMEADDEGQSHKPYNIIIFGFLWNRPNHAAMLKEIYEHVAEVCGKDPSQSGWKNSVRHNLSLNDGFEKAKGDSGTRKTSVWRLSNEALHTGRVLSTTKYRKASQRKKKSNGGQPSVKRQESGAKGGRATRDSHRRAKNAKVTKNGRLNHRGHIAPYLTPDQASSAGPSTPSTAYSRMTSTSPQMLQHPMPHIPYPVAIQYSQPPSSHPHPMQPMSEEMPQLYQPPMQALPPPVFENFEIDGNYCEGVADENYVYPSETPPLTSDTDMSTDEDAFNAYACITSCPTTIYGSHEQPCGA